MNKPGDILVTGAGGGIGLALLRELRGRYPKVTIHATWHRNYPGEDAAKQAENVHWRQCDCSEASDVKHLAAGFERLDWLVNCIGFLHRRSVLPNSPRPGAQLQGPEKSINAFETEFFLDNIKLNSLPTLLLARYFMAPLKQSPAAIFAAISAKVGSIEDNRLGGWYSYRSSKAALNMALKTLSIEWQRKCPAVCVASLHPGTTDTSLSKPFQSHVPAASLFSPEQTATYLVDRLATLRASDTGSFLAFDGEELPW